jgi:DNA-binding response OmpR family regulator
MARILVIEDDTLVGEWLADLLGRAGHDVRRAENGHEGIRLLAQSPADIVITDMIMPEKEGFETITELHRDHPEVPIVAISGGGQTGPKDYLETARLLGAAEVFAKPLDGPALLAKVSDLVG